MLSLFHHCFEQFESDPFFFLRERGVVCRVSGTGVRGWRFGIQGNVVRSSATTDRHRGNIPTRSQLRPFADYKENHGPPRPWPDSVAKANTRFCYSINCEPPAHMYKQGCPIFYWPFSSLNTQWTKTSMKMCLDQRSDSRCDSTGIVCGIIKQRNERTEERKTELLFWSMVYRCKFFSP